MQPRIDMIAGGGGLDQGNPGTTFFKKQPCTQFKELVSVPNSSKKKFWQPGNLCEHSKPEPSGDEEQGQLSNPKCNNFHPGHSNTTNQTLTANGFMPFGTKWHKEKKLPDSRKIAEKNSGNCRNIAVINYPPELIQRKGYNFELTGILEVSKWWRGLDTLPQKKKYNKQILR